ncbi:Pr6Pr family membrane protein [Mesorhizobium sp. M1423]|uniref:Pr6Pr family membrane protein n=1 Tax=Mesorhizobium sp. M1423 TaxID=2957101 RepID=UPI003339085A
MAYLAYALARGVAEGKYAYPFIDVSANGWVAVMSNAATIALGFIAAAEVLVLVDRMLAQR